MAEAKLIQIANGDDREAKVDGRNLIQLGHVRPFQVVIYTIRRLKKETIVTKSISFDHMSLRNSPVKSIRSARRERPNSTQNDGLKNDVELK